MNLVAWLRPSACALARTPPSASASHGLVRASTLISPRTYFAALVICGRLLLPLPAAGTPSPRASFPLRLLSVRASGITAPRLSFVLVGMPSAEGPHLICFAAAPPSETSFLPVLGGLAPSCATSGERSWTLALPSIPWGLGIQVFWRRCLTNQDQTPSSSLRVGGWQGVLSRRCGWLRISISPRHRASTHCHLRPA